MKRLYLPVLALLAAILAVVLVQTPSQAQTGSTTIKAIDTSTGATTNVGDNTNHALRVNMITGTTTVTQGTGTNLHVVCDSGCSSSTAPADESAFTTGVTSQSPVGGFFQTTATNNALTNGQMGAFQVTAQRAIFANLRSSTGTEITNTTGALDINIKSGGSTTVTEAATITANQSNSALTAAVLFGFDGSTDSRLRSRAGLVSSADVGLVVRPFLPSDGTNTMPAGDASARAVHIATDTGEITPMASATTTNASVACNILSAASTNSTNCKGSAGNFYGYEVYNTTTTVYYLRLYNSASAPTCSSATGFIRSIPIPPAASAGLVGGAVSNQVIPVGYSTGVGYCLTGGSSSTDNTNAATGVFGEIRYK